MIMFYIFKIWEQVGIKGMILMILKKIEVYTMNNIIGTTK